MWVLSDSQILGFRVQLVAGRPRYRENVLKSGSGDSKVVEDDSKKLWGMGYECR